MYLSTKYPHSELEQSFILKVSKYLIILNLKVSILLDINLHISLRDRKALKDKATVF